MTNRFAEHIVRARKSLMPELTEIRKTDDAAEGGCGVLGLAANIPVPGRHVLSASRQMHNRGNGKGGGIAMAGDPLDGGGFVVLNGIEVDDSGKIRDLESPFLGGNLLSLASGGAIYIRDPHRKISPDQLNGGMFIPLTQEDWDLIEPYLCENELLFGIRVKKLLEVDGISQPPANIYRKVVVYK